jgi:hypothetical protein
MTRKLAKVENLRFRKSRPSGFSVIVSISPAIAAELGPDRTLATVRVGSFFIATPAANEAELRRLVPTIEKAVA